MSILSEFKELVQLTERLLLENMPAKHVGKKPSLPPLKLTPPPSPAPKPAPPIATQPPSPPLPKPLRVFATSETDAAASLEVIKKLCPFLKMHDTTLLNQILILIEGNEPKEEKELFHRLQKRLDASGFPTLIKKAAESWGGEPRGILATRQALLSYPPLLEKARRTPQGKPLLDTTPLIVIPPPDTLIKDPSLRLKFWTSLLETLQKTV